MKDSSCKIIFMDVSEKNLYHRHLSLAECMFLGPRSREVQVSLFPTLCSMVQVQNTFPSLSTFLSPPYKPKVFTNII